MSLSTSNLSDPAEYLFTAVTLGAITLLHRIAHAPTTRLRASADESPSPMMLEYYTQRASHGGLIITETVHPSHDSRGYHGAPGIYTEAHVEGWRRITDAVHAKDGLIVLQIGHDGRQSQVDLSNGASPVAPSVVPFEGQAFTRDGWVPVSPHRALDTEEIPLITEAFRAAAERAKLAGFDGIELHNANGHLAERLNEYPLAYLYIIEPRVMGVETVEPTQEPVAAAFLRSIYKGKIIAAGGFERGSAEAILRRGDADVVAFGRFFTSNPDLPERFRLRLPLTPYRREAFWGGSERDYNDFPTFGLV